jgi:hypothetical protein
MFNFPQQREAADSILSEPGESEDDVFGSHGSNKLPIPKLPEIPPVPPPPVQAPTPVYLQPAPVPVMLPPQMAPAPAVSVQANPFAFENDSPPEPPPPPPKPRPASARPAPAASQPVAIPVQPQGLLVAATQEPIEELPEEEAAPKPKKKKKKSDSAAPVASSVILKVALLCVAGYAAVMTLVAIYGLFFKSGEKLDPGHPLSTIPDSFGEFDPVSRKKVSQYKFPVDGKLPETQVAGLGGKIEIGQLAIEPVKIESRKLNVIIENSREKKTDTSLARRGESLVMQLRITNTSNEFPIFPMDPALTRKARVDDEKPATRLIVGNQTFYGGAIVWPFPSNLTRRYEEQQEKDNIPLKPGETREYVVFTDSEQKILKAVKDSNDPLLWRVQVRRGLIEFKGKDVPVTAIIGVEFKAVDVKSQE